MWLLNLHSRCSIFLAKPNNSMQAMSDLSIRSAIVGRNIHVIHVYI